MADVQSAARVEESVRYALARHGGLGDIAGRVEANDDLYARGLTSLASVRVMLAIEEALSIEFPEELLTRSLFATIDSLVRVCTGLVRPSGSESSAESLA
jgi:acyl carrier protein